VVVALVAAVVSYEHLRHVATMAGEGWRAWLLPLSVDGLLVAASMVMLTRRRQGRPAGALAWGSLLLGIAASVAANVASAEATVTARLVAAWSPVALLLAVELLLQLLRPAHPAHPDREHGTEHESEHETDRDEKGVRS
jgi:lipopolysaccharide export LptBFGC system permease protein LptF